MSVEGRVKEGGSVKGDLRRRTEYFNGHFVNGNSHEANEEEYEQSPRHAMKFREGSGYGLGGFDATSDLPSWYNFEIQRIEVLRLRKWGGRNGSARVVFTPESE